MTSLKSLRKANADNVLQDSIGRLATKNLAMNSELRQGEHRSP